MAKALPEVTDLGVDREETKDAISCGSSRAAWPWLLGQQSDTPQCLGPTWNHRKHTSQHLQYRIPHTGMSLEMLCRSEG